MSEWQDRSIDARALDQNPDLYRPSNGTEGDWFMSHWCDRCSRSHGSCDILTATMAYDVTDPEYPREWREDERGPLCTAFAETDQPLNRFDPAAAIGLLL